MATQIKQYYGNITAENTIQGIVPIVQTGDLHIAVYDLSDQVCICFLPCSLRESFLVRSVILSRS
jgi:hypothetical protein